jgi:hypothetical protein
LTPPVVLPPAAPVNLKGTGVGKAEIRLRWADRSLDEAGFIIQRSSDGQTYETVQTLEFNITSTSDSPPGLRGRRSYSYRVVAFNAGGFSEPSNVVFVGDK